MREVHGLCGDAGAVVNVAVRWTEVQWRDADRVLDNLPGPAQMSDDAFIGEAGHRAWFQVWIAGERSCQFAAPRVVNDERLTLW